MLFVPFLPLFAGLAQAALTYKGVDWSSVPLEEAKGRSYKNAAGTTQPFETILKDSGVNTVRQRLWVNPSDGNYNLAYNVKLAKRAKAAGLQVYLDMHFSDTWADPGHQTTPSAWKNYNIGDLSWEVYNYTKDAMDAFQTAGVPLNIVSIGNEITAGMLWPSGQLSKSAANLAKLLHSASSAIKDSTLSTKPKIMIHLDNGWNWSTQQSWYDKVLAAGDLKSDDYDIQGVSYYPFYNSAATMSSLSSSLTNMKKKYGKEVHVAETNWPISCPNPSYAFPSDIKNIPFSAAGQTQFLTKLATTISGAGGDGLFYWEPAWIDNANLGSSCSSNLMVDTSGKALSSLAVFGTM